MTLKVMDDPINKEDYRGFRIKEMYAICAIDPSNDSEGVGGYISHRHVPMPFMATDDVRLESIKEIAQELSNETGQHYKVVKFSVREDIGEIVPQ